MREACNYYLTEFFRRLRCCRSSRKKRSIKEVDKDKLINKGVRKLERDLDIVKLITLQRDFQETKSVLFDTNDSTLLRMQQSHVISSDDSTSQSDYL